MTTLEAHHGWFRRGRASSRERPGAGRRIEPSVGVAVAAVLAYMVVVNGIQVSSGIDYQDWFDTAGNAVRTAVIPLAVGNVLLLAFVWWARWDIFWRDPERLPMTRLGIVIIGLFVATVVVRLAGLDLGGRARRPAAGHPGDRGARRAGRGLLFRGIVLRCLRTGDRPESSAALWTALGFGLFHLPNIFMGTGLAGLSQIVLAAITGYALYLFRRWHGLLWVAMVAHGTWDISAFLVGDYGKDVAAGAALALNLVLAAACVVALVRSLRRDRGFAVRPEGVVPVPA